MKVSIFRFSLIVCSLLGVVDSFCPRAAVVWSDHIAPNLYATSSSDEEEFTLLEKARMLREEAQLLEQELRREQTVKSASTSDFSPTVNSPPKIVTRLEDSVWTLSYRFSSQPKNDNNDDDAILPNYSGKLTLRLKADGYSELVALTNTNLGGDQQSLQIQKIWGWDEEDSKDSQDSQDDENQYLLFSMDVQIPKSDPKVPDETLRYFFQARIEREGSKNVIALKDGTITIKKDISEKTKGMWGLFQVAGILTEFRYVGDFVAKPAND